ncbi:nuclear transport factor 2 family protein [Rhodococcus erythropolis]|uniref:nuclear transport factor 2 family protein n=1 Tax=Rhodococcus erythropolis TaxID=1833 RepID=UPI00294A08A3|nr:nuclear transport factor 2 family protein [Rhodococcus erythropolis]MDV6275529.1 nuclear transport factor 2 family protein [Rhodococcus erythropolis]
MAADIKSALDDLIFSTGVSVQDAVSKHFSDDYRQRTNGQWDERDAFIEHIIHLRTVVTGGSIIVHEELVSGNTYADRHTVTIEKTDGTRAVTEVYLFGEHAPDGRFQRIEEVTLLISGSEEDAGLGNAR